MLKTSVLPGNVALIKLSQTLTKGQVAAKCAFCVCCGGVALNRNPKKESVYLCDKERMICSECAQTYCVSCHTYFLDSFGRIQNHIFVVGTHPFIKFHKAQESENHIFRDPFPMAGDTPPDVPGNVCCNCIRECLLRLADDDDDDFLPKNIRNYIKSMPRSEFKFPMDMQNFNVFVYGIIALEKNFNAFEHGRNYWTIEDDE